MLRALLISAVLPAALLMLYVYRQDTVEKEPWYLLRRLILLGALSCIPASVLEGVFLPLLSRLRPEKDLIYCAWEAFAVVALAEEGCKYLALRLGTWNSPDFNYRFDGIVYAVFVGLGFAALENILYVFNYGPGVVVSRGLFSVPAHMTFAVFMGLFYAHAKLADLNGFVSYRRGALVQSLLIPCLLHGFYDFCLLSGLEILSGFFLAFVVVLDVTSILVIRRQSREDQEL